MTGAANDLFQQINNAVLDLQGSALQTYQRPLKKLASLLQHPDLQAINAELTEGVNLDEFLQKSEQSQQGMRGSAALAWPDDHRETLGISLKLIEWLGEEPERATHLGFSYFHTGTKIIGGVHAVASQFVIPFVRDYKAYVMSRGNVEPKLIKKQSNRVFIVHGHDGEAREAVARFLSKAGLDPIILHEQASRGKTVIEKVEANSDVGFAVVLLTPDDEGRAKDGELEPRPRQNVLLELGYFIAKLGRERVCTLKRGEVQIPSDFAGVVWQPMDEAGGWKASLGKELEAAGYIIDWNKVMRS
jgi:hypothetical protein